MSCHNCIGLDIAGLRKQLEAQQRENDRLCATIAVLTREVRRLRGERHEDAERAVGAHLRDETPGAVPEKEQEE